MLAQLKRLAGSPAFIAVFAFAARMAILCYAWYTAKTPVNSFLPYGYELGRVASAIAGGKGFSSPLRFFDTGPTVWFTPIYPYFVAGIFKIWGIFSFTSRLVIQTSNCAFAALTVIPIYEIGRRVFGKTVAAGASWAWVFLPTALLFPITWIWDTSLAALFLALIFWATLALPGARSVSAWAGYGALCVTGVLVNPSILSVVPFLGAWAFWKSTLDLPARARASFAAALIFTLALVPWTIRNERVFGKFIVLRSNFGLELWLGNNPGVPETWSPWLHPNDSPEEAEKYKRMGEIPYMQEKEREALAFMREHPADTINFTLRRFLNTWLAITDSPSDLWSASPIQLKAFIVLNVLLSLSTLLGALFARRTHFDLALPFLAVIVFFPAVFYVTHSSLRYRFPMDPIMMVLAAYGVAYPISLWAGKVVPARESATAEAPAAQH